MRNVKPSETEGIEGTVDLEGTVGKSGAGGGPELYLLPPASIRKRAIGGLRLRNGCGEERVR